MTHNDWIKVLNDLINEELNNPKDVNMFYARYYSNHVGGIYESVDEAIKAWHNG